MSFYVFRFPARQTCALGMLGGGFAVAAYEAWDVARSRRNAVPLFNSAAVVRTEESARYPCERLRGFDVVVRSYYVLTDAKTETSSRSSISSTNDLAAAVNSSSKRFRRFVGLFSNHTHNVNSDFITQEQDGEAASVRLVVRDAKDAAALPTRATEDDTGLIAASRWPAHTTKYAALVLEPSATNGAGSSSTSSSRSLLRQLADGATHQSLVRCSPRSTLLNMACEGDPTYLGAPYLRVLLSGFLLLPSTLSHLNVAVLGVGGGSLALFLQEFFASRLHRCDLVDVEPMCFKAAVEQLGLKEQLNTVSSRTEGGGVHYYVEDAVQYLQQRVHPTETVGFTERLFSGALTPSSHEQNAPIPAKASMHASTPVFDTTPPLPSDGSGKSTAPSSHTRVSSSISSERHRQLDMLFVDLFVGSELDSAVTSVAFLRLCKGSLSPYGVAAFNLPAADKAFVQRCGAVFGDHNVFRVPVPASSNEVVLVRGGAGSHSDMVGPALSHRHLYRRAQELSAQYRLPYDLANHFPVWWRLW
jgi:spermidine synthase